MSTVPPLKPPKSARRPPKLPASAFAPPPAAAKRRVFPSGVIDTHIHLWPKDGAVDWPKKKVTAHALLRQPHDLAFYSDVVHDALKYGQWEETQWEGVVYVQAEADRSEEEKDGKKGGWDKSIAEIDSVCREALANPSAKLIGLVPWAPVHQGSSSLALYVPRILELSSLQELQKQHPDEPLIKSFRYLLETCEPGFFLKDAFVDGLRWLGENGYAFDLTLDATIQGPEILEEAAECISRVHTAQPDEDKRTSFILDHLSKPDLLRDATIPLSERHSAYVTNMFSLSLLPNVSIKLSGLLSVAEPKLVQDAFAEYLESLQLRPAAPPKSDAPEVHVVEPEEEEEVEKEEGVTSKDFAEAIPPVSEQEAIARKAGGSDASSALRRKVLTFVEPILESFGDSRIIVGSDWPMFRPVTIASSVDGGERDSREEAAAWAFEMEVYRQTLVDLGVEGDALDRIFSLNALEFYKL